MEHLFLIASYTIATLFTMEFIILPCSITFHINDVLWVISNNAKPLWNLILNTPLYFFFPNCSFNFNAPCIKCLINSFGCLLFIDRTSSWVFWCYKCLSLFSIYTIFGTLRNCSGCLLIKLVTLSTCLLIISITQHIPIASVLLSSPCFV